MMCSLDVQSSSQVFRLCDVLHVAMAGPLACMKCGEDVLMGWN